MDVYKSKKVFLEILRVIAIFGVIFCHTGEYGVNHYLETDSPVNYWLGIFLASVSQFCVPLFLIISGALLLHREESIRYVYRHRVLKFALATLVAILVQYAWSYYRDPKIGFEMKTFFRMMFEGRSFAPYWFLYSYLSFLLFLPFLQKLVKSIPNKIWFLYLFVAWEVIHGIFPILQYYMNWKESSLNLPVDDFIIYSMLGYFLEYCCDDIFYKKKNILMVLAGTLLLAVVNTYLNHVFLPDTTYVALSGLFAMVYAFAVYVAVKYICHRWKMPPLLEKIFCFAGAGVFGTYLMEGILREIFFPIYLKFSMIIFSYPAVFLWITACAVTGILITNLLKRIPVIGKIF